MILFPDLLQLPHQLRHPEVRDLAWVILAPPMLSDTPWPQRHPLAGSDWVQAPERLEHWLRQLDRDSYDLLHWLSQARTRRLGLYYERLWQFAVQHAPGIELIAANLPIRREGHTLGELDMLLRDRDGVHHLELAIKLYLGPQNGDGHDTAQWLGPGCHDRLDRKLAHLASINCRFPPARKAAKCWRRWISSSSVRSCGWAVICCIRGRDRPQPPERCASAAFARQLVASEGLAGRLSRSARPAAGNPCPAMPGWRRRITRRSRPGTRSNWRRG